MTAITNTKEAQVVKVNAAKYHHHQMQYDNITTTIAAAAINNTKMQCMHLHRQLHKISVAAIVFGLFLAFICVNGQIDGYIADVDYPAYDSVPKGLSFKCQGRLPGYYADTETRCQVWHWCLHSGHQYSFLCPNGTVFNQAVRVCDWWTNVNCPVAEQLYSNNEELYITTEPANHMDEDNL